MTVSPFHIKANARPESPNKVKGETLEGKRGVGGLGEFLALRGRQEIFTDLKLSFASFFFKFSGVQSCL